MSGPTRVLLATVDTARARMQAGGYPKLRAARAIARAGRTLLNRHPRDEALFEAFSLLRGRGFLPPEPITLPEGDALDVWRALEVRSQDDLKALSDRVLSLPNPSESPDAAARILEVFLACPASRDRADGLLKQMRGHVCPGQVALAELRHALGGEAHAPETQEGWEALLAPVRPHAEVAPRAVATALRLAASGWIGEQEAYGAHWACPVLGGRRIANLTASLLRRPALAEVFAPALAWLEEADALSLGRGEGAAEGLISAAEAADRQGDFEEGTSLLERALEKTQERIDVAAALIQRAELLLDPALGERVSTAVTEHHALEVATDLSARARRPLEPPAVTPPTELPTNWESALMAEDDALTAPEVLDAIGAQGRAAQAWLNQGGREGSLQAWRLRGHLDGEEVLRLVTRLQESCPEDELALGPETSARRIALALRTLLEDGSSAQRVLSFRLRASAAEAVAPPPAAEPTEEAEAPENDEGAADPSDDPHATANRLVAAADLIASGRVEAAGHVLAALWRHVESASERARLLSSTIEVLGAAHPGPQLLQSVRREILAWKENGHALVRALCETPRATHAIQDVLLHMGADDDRPDAQRLPALEAWVHACMARDTPPDGQSLRRLATRRPGLLSLAIVQARGTTTPLADARALRADLGDAPSARRWAAAVAGQKMD